MVRRASTDAGAALRSPKAHRTLPAVLRADEAEALIAATVEAAAETGGPLGLRDVALLELLYATGIRVGELVGLDVDDLDRQRNVVRVLGKGRKERTVPFGRPAAEALDRWLAEGRPGVARDGSGPALFLGARGGRMDQRAVRTLVHKSAAAVPGAPDLAPHGLRHTAATHLLEGGADLAIGTDRPGRPYRWLPLAVLPVWAYVRADDPWAGRGRVVLDELVHRPLIGLPSTFTARESLDAALVFSGLSVQHFAEAANGTVAQALAASGRGVAMVSDDPRYRLVPLAVGLRGQGGADLSVRLVAAWDGRSVAADSLQAIAVRLSGWATGHYGVPRE